MQPPLALKSAVVFEGAVVGPLPSKQFDDEPNPTKSTVFPPSGHPPIRTVKLFTKATLPAVALILMLPIASGVGRLAKGAVATPPSWTR